MDVFMYVRLYVCKSFLRIYIYIYIYIYVDPYVHICNA